MVQNAYNYYWTEPVVHERLDEKMTNAYHAVHQLAQQHGVNNRIGQVQKWFLFDVVDAAIEPTPDGHEFRAWQWVEPAWLIAHVPEWRRAAYERVLSTL